MWPEAAMGIPKYSEINMLHWIKPAEINYDLERNEFVADEKSLAKVNELLIQGPLPLSTGIKCLVPL